MQCEKLRKEEIERNQGGQAQEDEEVKESDYK
jgi:hypothetical protein